MKWQEARTIYPDRWLVIEAIQMQTESDRQVKLDEVAVLDMCDDGQKVMRLYQSWRQKLRGREILFVHSANPEPALYDLTDQGRFYHVPRTTPSVERV